MGEALLCNDPGEVEVREFVVSTIVFLMTLNISSVVKEGETENASLSVLKTLFMITFTVGVLSSFSRDRVV